MKIICERGSKLNIYGGVEGGVPMSHVDYNKWQCRPVDFKKTSCHPVDFKKVPCRPVDFKKIPCRLSLRPQKGRVAVSILVVHTPIYPYLFNHL